MMPSKTIRNGKLYDDRAKGASFGELAKKYHIKRPTAFKIYQRELILRGKKLDPAEKQII